MRTYSCSAWLVAAVALAAAARTQTTWHVSAGAPPGGDGSAGAPFATLQSAIDAGTTLDGDTLSVAAGVYVENIRMNGKLLTLRGEGGPTVTTVRAAAAGPVVLLDATGCYFEGFTVTGAFQGPALRVPAPQSGSAWIRRCIVTGNADVGLQQNYDAVVESCTIVGNGGAGIEMGSLAVLHMSSCIVWGNGVPVGPFTGFGTNVRWCVLDNGFCPPCGNLSVDPRLWNPQLGDFRLRPSSPCIDAGDPMAPPDADLSRRDIGALAFDAAYIPPPQPYCTSKVNSLGCTPAIGWSGLPQVSGGSFLIECTQVLNQRAGLLFYGFQPQFLPFQGGRLCVRAPTVRTPVANSGGHPAPPDDCSGVYSFDFGARIHSGVDPALSAGALVYAQFWFRDPASSFQSGRSDAVSFGVRP